MRLTNFLLNKVGELTKLYSNLPQRYIDRVTNKVYYRTPKAVQYQKKEIKRKKVHFSTSRPWEADFQRDNSTGVHHAKVFLQPVVDWPVFKGDRVEILVGKDKGKQGIVKIIYQERNWVIVEGLNCELRQMGKKGDPTAAYYKHELPLNVLSEIKLVDPSDLVGTSIEWRYTESGDKVRVSTRTGRIIPIPKIAEETYDYKSKVQYLNSTKDTDEKVVAECTFEPKLMTFEMDIMQQKGIQENREPVETYWY